ncbi:MAG: succinyl-diaminopimelate desuccinylase [Acidimicrobiales bacterium]|nr:succinyl-diaminopimelate desuccinylase [Acidimicrobiales bacterium]
MTDLLALTASLVDIPSVSFDEQRLVTQLETELRSVPWLDVHRVGDNLVARTQLGRSTRVLLGGHSDTVAPNANLGARIEGDTLWGLGAADMKGGLAVLLELARTVSEPAVDVTYLIYAREEVASEHNGLRELFSLAPDLLAADVALLGEPTDGVIEAGCQGTLRLQLTLRGARAHTARPWMGRNAIHRLAAVLERVAAFEERRPVIDGCEYREALQAVSVEGGVAGNVVPDEARLTVNHRFAPDRTLAEAEAWLRSYLAPGLEDGDVAELTDGASSAPPGLSHPLLAAMIQRHQLPVRAKLGWTDVAFFAEHGIPAANFGPGDATVAHTADEHLRREPLERSHQVLHDLLVRGI